MRARSNTTLAALAIAAVLSACGNSGEKNAPVCTDGIRNGSETDVDCGGSCAACLDGRACGIDSDCLSAKCVAGTCGEPVVSCSDGVKNGSETDADCGGETCEACAEGKACGQSSDCATGFCKAGVCLPKPPPSCSDGERNADETDVDCGGSCEACDEGDKCVYDEDCESNVCGERYTCVSRPEGCFDERKNGVETGVDCGQGCPPCPEGSGCLNHTDCQRGICIDAICDAPTTGQCVDGIKNGEETDIDCGGLECSACEIGFRCSREGDCFGGILCASGICGEDPCYDAEKNGHETDVDCGGAVCHQCGANKACLRHDDCISGECTGGYCTEPPDTCNNDLVDGNELDEDCGGGLCPTCPDGYRCRFNQDCEIGFCDNGVCGFSTCTDESINGHETDLNCGGGVCAPCSAGKACLENSDCESLSCSDLVCDLHAATCNNNQLDGNETDVDCGGPGCLPCAEGQRCLEHRDCASGGCAFDVCGVSIADLQSGTDSVWCTAAGTTVVRPNVKLGVVYVSSPVFTIDQAYDGFYVQRLTDRSLGQTDTRHMGMLVVAHATMTADVDQQEEIELLGDYRENGCMSELFVAPQQGRLLSKPLTSVLPSTTLDPSLLENGGSALAEPYEGVLVTVPNLTVGDTSGFTGQESPGHPHWWFMAGNGIYVANDFDVPTPSFDLPVLPEPGDVVTVKGVLKQRQGVYLVVAMAVHLNEAK